jgi:uncharacterized membrane protein
MYRNGEPLEGRCYVYQDKGWTAVYREGKPWLGFAPSGGATELVDLWKFHINGIVTGTMRNGQCWDGIFIDVDDRTGRLVSKYYREGREVRGCAPEKAMLQWDDPAGTFTEVPWPL